MSLKAKMKATLPFKSLVDGTTDIWTESTTKAGEFFQDPETVKIKPLNVMFDGVDLTEGELGNLNYKEWAWGNNDSNNYDTLYICLTPLLWAASTTYTLDNVRKSAAGDFYECTTAGESGASEPTWNTTEGATTTDNTATWTRIANINADPDDNDIDSVQCSELVEIFQAAVGIETIAIGMIIANNEDSDANIILAITDKNDVVKFIEMFDILSTDSPVTESTKIVVSAEDKLKIMSNREMVSIMVSEDES